MQRASSSDLGDSGQRVEGPSRQHHRRGALRAALSCIVVAGFTVASLDVAVSVAGSSVRATASVRATVATHSLAQDQPHAQTPAGGYWLIGTDGGIFSFGSAQFFGSTGNLKLNKPIVGMASTPDGRGYWLVASDGGIFSFGDAQFLGSTGAITLNKPIVAMATTPDGGGYWLVASDGGIFSFGDAQFYGSTGAITLNKRIVGMARTPDGRGYWLVALDGGIFSFGDAQFYGSTGAITLNKPITGMAPTPDGNGYWLAAVDGGIFSFGDAQFHGSTVGLGLQNVLFFGMAATPDGGGYWLVDSDGTVFNFGDAQAFGSVTGHLNSPILGLALSPPAGRSFHEASKLVFSTQPAGATGATPFATQPKVTVEDASGNPVATDASTVTLTIASGTPTAGGPGTLSTCTQSGESGGVISFSGCSINTVGTGYELHATDGSLDATTSAPFNVTPGHPSHLVFTTQPDATAGAPLTQQPVVTIEDGGGNTVTSDTNAISLAVQTGPGTLIGCTSTPAVAGVATFSGCQINKAASGYSLTATDAGDGLQATSSLFSVSPGPAAQLVFTTEPSATALGGAAFATQPVVTVEDAFGNTVTTDTSTVTLAANGGPSALSGCSPTAAIAGVATFSGCKLNLDGTYTLHATDGALTAANSTNVTVSTGPAAQLAFTTEPSATATGGTAFAQQPVVTVEDAGGNTVTTDTSMVTLAANGGPSSLSGCSVTAAVAGVATFSGCKLNLDGTYTLHATDGALTATNSTNIVVSTGPSAQLVFTTEPSSTAFGGTAFSQQPVVTVEDAGGNTVTTDSSTVTLTAAGGPSALSGCSTAVAASGVATFSGCKLNLDGTYTLHAADGALTTANSTNIVVSTGAASQLAFTTEPSATATGGTPFTQQPVVTVEDAGGNKVTTDSSTVTLTAAGGPSALSGCSTAVASAGVATFSGCALNLDGTYTLHAADGALTAANSTNIVVSTGPAAQLAFTTQPSASANGGTPFTQQPVVTVEDAGGNKVTTDSSTVTLTAAGGPSSLSGCSTAVASSGVATFSGCTLNLNGTYHLHATDGSLTAANSANIVVSAGPPAKLVFSTQPAGATAGSAFTTQPVVTIEDAGGNTVTADTNGITLTKQTGPGALINCSSPATSAGVATFSGCEIDTSGSYTLTATDAGDALSVVSASFTVNPGAAFQLTFTTEPSLAASGGTAFATQPVVTVQDAFGNTVTTDTSTVTLTSTGGPSALTGCSSAAAVAGVATFSGCTLNLVGTYHLHAADGTLAAATSTNIVVATGPEAKLVFTTEPSATASGGIAFVQQPVVTAEDAGGNTVTTDDTSTVTLIANGGPSALAGGPTTVTLTSGVATFSGLHLNLDGTYTLHATSSAGGVTAADSTNIVVSTGAAAQLAFTTEPSATATGGTPFAPQPVVTVEDAGGNTVTTDSSTVSLAANGGPSSLGGCSTAVASSGVATFSGCKLNVDGTYTLHATDGTLTAANSTSILVSTGAASQLVFTTQPSGATAGAAFTQQPVVTIEDAGGNTVTADTNGIVLTKQTGPGALINCSTPATTAGVATFAGCEIDTTGSYTLTATDAGDSLTAVSSSFTVNPGAASQLVFTTEPSATATGGTAFAQQPVVTEEDAQGNTITTDNTNTVFLSASGGPSALGGCNSAGLLGGVGTFSGCSLALDGTYTLHAGDSLGGVTPADSTAIVVSTGPSSQLAFTTEPSATASGGTPFAQQPVVTIEDAGGNTVTTDTSVVSLVATGGSGTLSGCGPTAAVAGVATFSGCKIDLSGIYMLQADDGVLTSAFSTNIAVSAGAASQIVFTTEPSGASGGTAFTQQPVVTVEDAGGNTVTSDASPITLSILANPSGGTLSTCSATTTGGVATFSGCTIDKAGNGYSLLAVDSVDSLSTTSSVFNVVVGPPAQLAFTTEPSATATGGTAFAQQAVVTVEDAGGNTVTTDTSTVTLTANGGPSALTGCSPTAAVAGVATFTGCTLDLDGNYTLHATDGALTPDDSTNIAVGTGTATKLAFTTEPSATASGGTPFAQQPVVTVEDAGGNTVTTDSSTVTLTAVGGSSPLSGCSSASASSGVATFSGCKLNLDGTYHLHAADGLLTTADSSNIVVSTGAAAQLAFTTEPSATASGGTVFAQQPVVTVEDAGGNTVTTDGSTVTLTAAGGSSSLSGCSTAVASSGVATFSGCKLNLDGTYHLQATDGTLTAANSSNIVVSTGAAAQLAFTTEPSATATGGTPFTQQPAVTIEDAGGNTVTTDSSTVTLTAAGGTSSLSGCSTAVAASGVATFSGCTLNVDGTYHLHAIDGTLTAADSTNIVVSTGAAAKLAFTTEPSATATGGTPFAQQPVVTVEDAGGNTVTTDTSTVFLTAAGGASPLSGCSPTAAIAGVATFSGCKLALNGTYTLHAADGLLTTANSTNIVVSTGAASQLVFTAEPSATATGGTPFAQQPVVNVEDAGGNTVTTDGSTVTLTSVGGPSPLSGCSTAVAASGVATFSGCKLAVDGTYTLHAADGALTPANSTNIVVSTGVAAQLAFTTEPSGTATGGTAFAQQPVVTVEDAGGNTVTTDSSTVTLTAAGGPSALSGCSTAVASSGVATFSGCKLAVDGTYTLHAVDGTLTAADSSNIVVSTGAAAKLAFTTQPSATATGGTPFAQQPVVTVEDAGGNTVTTDSSTVTLTSAGGPSLLSGCSTAVAASGVATFSGCKLAVDGTYTLHAADGLLTTANSTNIVVSTGAASQLVFTTQPGGATAGLAFTIQPVVTIEDAGGNTVTGDVNSIVLTKHTGPGLLINCSTPATTAGVATFSGCEIDTTGSYTLTATDGGDGLSAFSASFTVNPGAATQLAFTTEPSSSANGGTAFAQQPVVTEQDAHGNTVTGDNTSAVTLTANGGPSALSGCSTTLTVVAGVATFSGCALAVDGSYTLHATSNAGGVAATDSTAISVTTGPAAQLVFTTPPSGAQGGTAFTQQPVVTIEDAGGNTVTTDSNAVTLTKNSGPGTLTGCSPSTVAGVATFSGCTLDLVGSYTLQAHDAGDSLTKISGSFSVSAGPASKIVFTVQPGGAHGGTAFTQQPVVTIEDAGGNTVTTDASPISLLILANPSGGTLTGCTSTTAAGVAAFGGCTIDKAGNGYSLLAADSLDSLSVISGSFNVVVGAAAKLAFTTEPSSTATGGTAFTTQPIVTVEDAGGNTVTTDTSTVTLTSAGGSSALSGCSPTAAVAGVATFSGCALALDGTYTLHATDAALTPADSTNIVVSTGTASKLAFTTEPGGATAGAAFSTQPVVTIEDAGGNTVTTDTSGIVLTKHTGTGTLINCSTPTTTAGVATFSGCEIDTTGSYTLTATDAGDALSMFSQSFTVSPAPATQLVFTTEPSAVATAGTPFATQPVVTEQDAHGNTVTGDSTSQITLAAMGGSSSLSGCTTPVTLVNGVAAFSGCSLDLAGTYQLHATDSLGGVSAADSTNIVISHATASQLAFTTEPSSTATAGVAFSQQPTVTEQDAFGNTVTSDSTSTVTLTAIGGSLTGCAATTVTLSNGVATFSGCAIDVVGTYTLHAASSAAGVNPANSTAVTVNPAAASQLAFTPDPSPTATAGVAFAQQPAVSEEDAFGNLIISDNTSTVTLAVNTGPGSLTGCAATTVTLSSGVATFSGCTLDIAGTYTLHASSSAAGVSAVNSTAITVSPAAASQLVFSTQPGVAITALPFLTQPALTVKDPFGNIVTTDVSTVTLSITSGTPTVGSGTLSGCTQSGEVAGVISFSGCTITGIGTGFELHAVDSGFATPTDSNPFGVT